MLGGISENMKTFNYNYKFIRLLRKRCFASVSDGQSVNGAQSLSGVQGLTGSRSASGAQRVVVDRA